MWEEYIQSVRTPLPPYKRQGMLLQIPPCFCGVRGFDAADVFLTPHHMPFPNIDFDSTTRPFVQHLMYIVAHEDESLRTKVAADALDRSVRPEDYFTDLLENGCISGMVSDLIYYTDTRKFFDQNYEEIETLREEYRAATGESIMQYCDGDLKNFLAWFGYEKTARNIWEEFHERE